MIHLANDTFLSKLRGTDESHESRKRQRPYGIQVSAQILIKVPKQTKIQMNVNGKRISMQNL